MKVNRSVSVGVAPEMAFAIFTEQIGMWWPLGEGYAFAGDRWQDLVIESREGGRVYERARDGEVFHIGSVTVFEPPERIVITWGEATKEWAAPTEVEVRFTEEAGGTRVDLEHRAFERVGPGAEESAKDYERGWPMVLDRFVRHAGRKAS
ncbi:MAG: SRPBCC domain-containing protein [Actinomycetota bacterium]